MDGRMNFRNWNFTEDTQPPHSNGNVNGFSSHLGLQLKSPIDEKPLFGGGGGGVGGGSSNGVNGVNGEHHHVHPMSSMSGGLFHHHRGISDSHHMAGNNYWMNPEREKYMHLLSGNRHHGFYQPAFGVAPEAASSAHPIQMTQQLTLPKSETMVPQVEEVLGEGETDNGLLPKKRAIEKLIKATPKEKKPRTRVPRTPKDFPSSSENRARAPKKRAEVVINGVTMDITGIAIPVCSCTGTPQQCYRWGSGGWQSACCTTSLSMYPLPMSTKRRGARIAGRKMSIGAFTKVLEKLASEGYNFSNPIDLKCFWAKHGTNKFVTIR